MFLISPKFTDQKAEEIFWEEGFHENGNFRLKKSCVKNHFKTRLWSHITPLMLAIDDIEQANFECVQ